VDTYNQFFNKYNKALVALSGGADSAYALILAVQHMGCENIVAATCVNNHIFNYEIENARKICEFLGVKHIEFITEVTPEFLKNDDQRCYHCKKTIMSQMQTISDHEVIFDGTNIDDDASDRPGSKAISELKIISPLKELGIGKELILSKVAHLPVVFHDDSCKATRLTHTIDDERMSLVEKLEDQLRDKFSGVRYRIDDKQLAFNKPIRLYKKDFEYINKIKHQNE